MRGLFLVWFGFLLFLGGAGWFGASVCVCV